MLKELAIVYAELGEMERAFEYLERAYAEDPGSLSYINADPTAGALSHFRPTADPLPTKMSQNALKSLYTHCQTHIGSFGVVFSMKGDTSRLSLPTHFGPTFNPNGSFWSKFFMYAFPESH